MPTQADTRQSVIGPHTQDAATETCRDKFARLESYPARLSVAGLAQLRKLFSLSRSFGQTPVCIICRHSGINVRHDRAAIRELHVSLQQHWTPVVKNTAEVRIVFLFDGQNRKPLTG